MSIYTAAYVFFQLPHGLVAVSLMTTLTPELAETATRGDFAGYRRNFAMGVRLMTLAILPAVACAGPPNRRPCAFRCAYSELAGESEVAVSK